MKTMILAVLVTSFAFATTAMADVYNSKASTGKIPAASSAVLTVSDFNANRLSSKIQTVSTADVSSIKTDSTAACSKPMDPATCKAHCPS